MFNIIIALLVGILIGFTGAAIIAVGTCDDEEKDWGDEEK